MDDRWAVDGGRGQVKLNVDEHFALKSQRWKCGVAEKIHRGGAQRRIVILNRLRVEHASILCVQNCVNDYRLKIRLCWRVARIHAQWKAIGQSQRKSVAGVKHLLC